MPASCFGCESIRQRPVRSEEETDPCTKDAAKDQHAAHIRGKEHQEHSGGCNEGGNVEDPLRAIFIRQPAADEDENDQGDGQRGQQVTGLLGRVRDAQDILQIILGKRLHAVDAEQE